MKKYKIELRKIEENSTNINVGDYTNYGIVTERKNNDIICFNLNNQGTCCIPDKINKYKIYLKEINPIKEPIESEYSMKIDCYYEDKDKYVTEYNKWKDIEDNLFEIEVSPREGKKLFYDLLNERNFILTDKDFEISSGYASISDRYIEDTFLIGKFEIFLISNGIIDKKIRREIIDYLTKFKLI